MEVWELVERTAALLGKSANNAQSYLLEWSYVPKIYKTP
jgi:hypothetical protein